MALSMQRVEGTFSPARLTGVLNTYNNASNTVNNHAAPTINITVNNPNVRSDQDIRDIERQLTKLTRNTMLGYGFRNG